MRLCRLRVLEVKAFQINDNAIVSITDNGELVASGIFRSERDGDVRYLDVLGKCVRCTVEEVDSDPARVGSYEGQVRYFWRGRVTGYRGHRQEFR